ncbi:hypothetical protein AB833_24975 [Chromatiales bacterium (ex Bugula neritina AB1)]|nr:hypothetical protein AB833_24975 [Chromatiales bacterium (ex Bugula neritina AB1)]
MAYQLQISPHPSELRAQYLDSLSEPQEFFVEALVSGGTTLTYGGFAYAVVAGDMLVEIYTTPAHTHNLVELFQLVIDKHSINTVLCKSYDTQLLYAALSKEAKVATAGYLFRRILDVPHERTAAGVCFRAAEHKDIEAVMQINDDFFESIEEVSDYRTNGGLFVLETNQGIVGCGTGKAVVPGRDDIDIGMLVAKTHRNRGLGRYIASCLKDHFLRHGLRPICGCGASNHASKRALEKAGFACDHRLLSISY